VRAGASNENLDQGLNEIRQRAACVRDELFEAVSDLGASRQRRSYAGGMSSLSTIGRAALRPRRARGWHIVEKDEGRLVTTRRRERRKSG
jgi:hypothetical protein